jgi:hypothetical protein
MLSLVDGSEPGLEIGHSGDDLHRENTTLFDQLFPVHSR